ncbi:hypothetical protein [Archaeoglobus sulfaticallidus]|uniref:hypothetical protein n=1 Tax=Archaeoglobus sulfaticallidus TaxID=1316941 RepID=UPI001F23BDE3|nr:hypothetical protein [Archaeoglobus sulfaticallidus]
MAIMVSISRAIDWLNDNSGTIQAIATIILVIVTYKYVRLTRELVNETRREIQSKRMEELVNKIMIPLKEHAKANYEDLANREYGYKFRTKRIRTFKLNLNDTTILMKDFKQDYPSIYEKIKTHDELREKLKTAVRNLAERILELPDFKKRCHQMVKEYNDNASAEDKLTGSQLEDFPEILIGDIIDRTENFREQDIFRRFWQRYRNELIGFLDREEVKEEVKKVQELTDELLKILATIVSELDNEILKIWRKYKIELRDYVVI